MSKESSYLNASSLRKSFVYVNEKDEAGNPAEERAEFQMDVAEKISISLTHEKAVDLINRLETALNDQSGGGGVYVNMYCRKAKNKHTGEIFDGMGIAINPKKPSQKPQRRGAFNNNNQGRREFPKATQGSPAPTVRPATKPAHKPQERFNEPEF